MLPIPADRIMIDGYAIRLVSCAFADCFKGARLATTGGEDLEHNKYAGQFSTIMRALTRKDWDLISYIDKVNEFEAEISNTSLKQVLIDNLDIAANKRKIKGKLLIEHIFGFCKTFKKNTEQLGFHLTFRTADF